MTDKEVCSGEGSMVQKHAEEESQRERAFFDQLVETAPEGIAITDTQGRVLRANVEFVRMFGYGVDEVVGQCLDDLAAPPARLADTMKQQLDQPAVQAELEKVASKQSDPYSLADIIFEQSWRNT